MDLPATSCLLVLGQRRGTTCCEHWRDGAGCILLTAQALLRAIIREERS
jgi:hypothetical protein